MPPRTTTTRVFGGTRPAAAAAAVDERLSPARYVLHALALLVTLAVSVAGIAGFVVLMDDENELSISKTDFADRWRWLIAKNAFVQPFAVNFGLIGAGYCVSKLLGHHRRRRQQPEDDAAAAAAAAKRD